MSTLRLDVTHEQAKDWLNTLKTDEKRLTNELERIRGNIKTIEAFIAPSRLIATVRSSNGYGSYTVSEDINGEKSCTCKSFMFKNGLDGSGHCKHIRYVVYGTPMWQTPR